MPRVFGQQIQQISLAIQRLLILYVSILAATVAIQAMVGRVFHPIAKRLDGRGVLCSMQMMSCTKKQKLRPEGSTRMLTPRAYVVSNAL